MCVPLHKGKGNKNECNNNNNNNRGLSLPSVPRKVYGRILTERLMEVTEGKISGEQGEFRKGKKTAWTRQNDCGAVLKEG